MKIKLSPFYKLVLLLVMCFTNEISGVYGQWTITNGPFGYKVIKLVNLDTFLVAATDQRGVFTSSDNGNSWVGGSFNGINGRTLNDLESLGNNLFVTCNCSNGGVFTSIDNGLNWSQTNNGLPSASGYNLQKYGNRLFVHTASGIYYSDNYGLLWQPYSSGIPGLFISSFVEIGADLYMSSNRGVFRSVNGGISWNPLNSGLDSTNVFSLTTDGTNLYVASLNVGVYVSTNLGNSWTLLNNGLTELSFSKLAYQSPYLVAGTNNGIFVSNNGGTQWTDKTAGVFHRNIYDIYFDSTLMWIGTIGGMYNSSDFGSTWNYANNGMAISVVSDLIVQNDTLFSANEFAGLFRSTDHGNSWEPIDLQIPGTENCIIQQLYSDNGLFYALSNTRLHRSYDNGVSWEHIDTSLSASVVKNTFRVIDGELFIGSQNDGIYISSDSGATWVSSNTGILTQHLFIRSIVEVDSSIFTSNSGAIYKSDDHGATWALVYQAPFPPGTGKLEYIDGVLIFSLIGDIVLSYDKGQTWVTSTLSYDLRDVVKMNDRIYGATSHGVCMSADTGYSWIFVNGGLMTNQNILNLAIGGNDIYAGTPYSGIFKNSTLFCLTQNTINVSACGSFTSPSGNFTWNSSGIYYDTIPNMAGCDSLLTINLTINQPPSFNITGDSVFCYGDSVVLSPSISLSSYLWSTGFTSASITIDTTGIFSLVGTDSLGCQSSDTIFVEQVYNNPTISGDSLICPGDTIVLNSAVNFPSTYMWSTGATGVTTNITGPGTYFLIATTTHGCLDSAIFQIAGLPAPNVTISAFGLTTFCVGDSVLLSEPNNYNTYQWYKGANIAFGATNSNNYYAKTRGNYYCIATDQNGCSDTSNSIFVKVPCYPIGPNHEKATSFYIPVEMTVFPNPTTKNVLIEGPQGKVMIMDNNGKIVFTEHKLKDQLNIDVSFLFKGLYIVRLITDRAVYNKRLIIE